MVLLDNDGFLAALTKLFQQARVSGSVFLTMKKYNGRTKPIPKLKKKKAGSSPKKAAGGTTSPEPEDNLCLLRAMDGKKKKISTVVHAKDVTRFQLAYANLLKANLDGLKKRDKKTAKAAAVKARKSKAAS